MAILRDKILKFEGNYHGHADALLLKAGSGLTLGVPNSPGIPEDFAKHTLTVEYNNIDSVKDILLSMATKSPVLLLNPLLAI